MQQVGRGGRDGRSATCIAFVDDADYLRLRALTHSGTAPQHALERFLARVFGRPEPTVGGEGAGGARHNGREDDVAVGTGGNKKKRHSRSAAPPPELLHSQHRWVRQGTARCTACLAGTCVRACVHAHTQSYTLPERQTHTHNHTHYLSDKHTHTPSFCTQVLIPYHPLSTTGHCRSGPHVLSWICKRKS